MEACFLIFSREGLEPRIQILNQKVHFHVYLKIMSSEAEINTEVSCPENVVLKFLTDQGLLSSIDPHELKNCRMLDFYNKIYSKKEIGDRWAFHNNDDDAFPDDILKKQLRDILDCDNETTIRSVIELEGEKVPVNKGKYIVDDFSFQFVSKLGNAVTCFPLNVGCRFAFCELGGYYALSINPFCLSNRLFILYYKGKIVCYSNVKQVKHVGEYLSLKTKEGIKSLNARYRKLNPPNESPYRVIHEGEEVTEFLDSRHYSSGIGVFFRDNMFRTIGNFFCVGDEVKLWKGYSLEERTRRSDMWLGGGGWNYGGNYGGEEKLVVDRLWDHGEDLRFLKDLPLEMMKLNVYSRGVWISTAESLYEMGEIPALHDFSKVMNLMERKIYSYDLLKHSSLEIADFSSLYQSFVCHLHWMNSLPDNQFSKIPRDVLNHVIIPYLSEIEVFYTILKNVKKIIKIKYYDDQLVNVCPKLEEKTFNNFKRYEEPFKMLRTIHTLYHNRFFEKTKEKVFEHFVTTTKKKKVKNEVIEYQTFSDVFVEVMKKLLVDIEEDDYVHRCLRYRFFQFMTTFLESKRGNEEHFMVETQHYRRNIIVGEEADEEKQPEEEKTEKKGIEFVFDISMFQEIFEHVLESSHKPHLTSFLLSEDVRSSFFSFFTVVSYPSISFLKQVDLWIRIYSHFFSLDDEDKERISLPRSKMKVISASTLQLIEVYLLSFLSSSEEDDFSEEDQDRVCKCFEIVHSMFQNIPKSRVSLRYGHSVSSSVGNVSRSIRDLGRELMLIRFSGGSSRSPFFEWNKMVSLEKRIQRLLIHVFKIKKTKQKKEEEEEEDEFRPFLDLFLKNFGERYKNSPFFMNFPNNNNIDNNNEDELWIHTDENMLGNEVSDDFHIFFQFMETLFEVDFPSDLHLPCLPIIFETCSDYFDRTRLKIDKGKGMVAKILDLLKFVDEKEEWNFCEVLAKNSRSRITKFITSLVRNEKVYHSLPNKILMQVLEIISIILRNEVRLDYRSTSKKPPKLSVEEAKKRKDVDALAEHMAGAHRDAYIDSMGVFSGLTRSAPIRKCFESNVRDVIIPLINVVSSKKAFKRFAWTFERCRLIEMSSRVYELVKSMIQERKENCEVLFGPYFEDQLGTSDFSTIDFQNIKTAIEFLKMVDFKDEDITEEKVELYLSKAEESWMCLSGKADGKSHVKVVEDARDFAALLILYDHSSKMKENIFRINEKLMRRLTKILVRIPFIIKNKSKTINLEHVSDLEYFLKKRDLVGKIHEEDVEELLKNTILELKMLKESKKEEKVVVDRQQQNAQLERHEKLVRIREDRKARERSIVSFALTISAHPSFRCPDLFLAFRTMWFENYGSDDFFLQSLKTLFSRMRKEEQVVHGQEFLDWILTMIERSYGFKHNEDGLILEISDVCEILSEVLLLNFDESISQILTIKSALGLVETFGKFLQNDLISRHHLRIIQTITGFLKNFGSGSEEKREENSMLLGTSLLDSKIVETVLKMTYSVFPKNTITYHCTDFLLLVINNYPDIFLQNKNDLTKRMFEYIFRSKYVSDRDSVQNQSKVYVEKTSEVILRIIDIFHAKNELEELVKKPHFGKVVLLVGEPFKTYLSKRDIKWESVGCEEEVEEENEEKEGEFTSNARMYSFDVLNNSIRFQESVIKFGFDDGDGGDENSNVTGFKQDEDGEVENDFGWGGNDEDDDQNDQAGTGFSFPDGFGGFESL